MLALYCYVMFFFFVSCMLVVVISTCDYCITSIIREQMLMQMLLMMHMCEETCWENFGRFWKAFEKSFCFF